MPICHCWFCEKHRKEKKIRHLFLDGEHKHKMAYIPGGLELSDISSPKPSLSQENVNETLPDVLPQTPPSPTPTSTFELRPSRIPGPISTPGNGGHPSKRRATSLTSIPTAPSFAPAEAEKHEQAQKGTRGIPSCAAS